MGEPATPAIHVGEPEGHFDVLFRCEWSESPTTLSVPNTSKFRDVISIASKHFGKDFTAISLPEMELDENWVLADYFEPDGIFTLSIGIIRGSVAAEWDRVIAVWLNATAPLTLKWQSDDARDVKGFHSACDGVANTLVIVKSKDGNIFGGFSVTAWDSSSGKLADPTGLSFVFVLKNTFGDSPTRFPLKGKGRPAIFCRGDCGPLFYGTICVWGPSASWAQVDPSELSFVDVLGRGVAGFVASGTGDCINKFGVESYEVWMAAGPPTACA
jgi:hypothetical protein